MNYVGLLTNNIPPNRIGPQVGVLETAKIWSPMAAGSEPILPTYCVSRFVAKGNLSGRLLRARELVRDLRLHESEPWKCFLFAVILKLNLLHSQRKRWQGSETWN